MASYVPLALQQQVRIKFLATFNERPDCAFLRCCRTLLIDKHNWFLQFQDTQLARAYSCETNVWTEWVNYGDRGRQSWTLAVTVAITHLHNPALVRRNPTGFGVDASSP